MLTLPSLSDKTVAIIGGGPAGLMAAELISQSGAKVNVYDAMPSIGRKFLIAGKGGLNITHSDPYDLFLTRYGSRSTYIKPMLDRFDAEALKAWVHELGIQTFIGSSGRIFPSEMKAAPLLRGWLHRLRQSGVTFHVRHQWLGWHETDSQVLRFMSPQGIREVKADAVVLALGGGSWPQLGSTGAWTSLLTHRGVQIIPLVPSNCGFDVSWSEHFRDRFAGQPLKSVIASFNGFQQQGDCMITTTGIEGSLIYALSAPLRDEIALSRTATLTLDLAPGNSIETLISKFSQPRGKQSMANHLRKRLGFDGVKAGLLREIVPAEDFNEPIKLCSAIKALPIKLTATRPIAEAISSAGGVSFDAIDEHLMLRALPGVFCAGEMLDWEAPTGGYLLAACFASGRVAGGGVLKWLDSQTI
ncbi:TIGR03862 family flavoprotein [Methyloglobulus sp.]|uniref:TIGR03862 family flavoprotein n=1 Tax=Methyloglobulus sp. TaxID=2518622 RepID=UPI0032B808A1